MDKKVLLQDLADGLARRKNLSKKDAETFIRTIFEVIQEFLLTEQLVKVKGLGTFKLVTVDSRESINVNTGERIVIDSHSKITFTPDKSMSDHVNRPFADFETVLLNDKTRTEEMERIDMTESVAEEIPVADPKPEPVAEQDSISKQDSVAESEPVMAPEPVVEVEPVAEPEVKPITESEPIAEPESAPEEKTSEPKPAVEIIPEIEGKQDPVPPITPLQPTSHVKKIMRWIILLFILALVALLLWWLFICEPNRNSQPIENPVEAQSKDTVIEMVVVKPETPAPDPETLAADYPQIEGGEYWIVGTKATVTLQRGDDLTKLALEHYGDKKLINYIIKYNHLTAAKASNLFVGAEVKIPELVKKE